jgi:putative endonuclease
MEKEFAIQNQSPDGYFLLKTNHRQSLGHTGENIAAGYLENKGYDVIARNFRTPYGEIDIIARLEDTIVFIEIKTRATKTLGPPEISITRRKAEHMRSAAEYYVQQHPELKNEWRIDAISVQMQAHDNPMIVHFENAIT